MRITSWSVSALVFAAPLAAQKINPTNQINWPQAAGSGAPTAACTAANWGQPYTDVSGQITWSCGAGGWFQGSGGGGTSGVRSINTVTGAFTFNGSGVACVGTTCTFSGGSGGGVGPGAASEVTVYSGPTSVVGDPYLLDSAAATSGNGMFSYSGKLGGQFVTSFGGSFNVLLNNNGGTPSSSPANQINLTTLLNTVSTPQAGAGNIVLNANDVIGNNGAANINISASTPVANTTSNSGNVNISANGYPSNNSGFINLLANGISISDNSAGVSITTNSAQTGTPIALANNAPGGTIQLNARTGFLIFGSTNLSVDGAGDITDPSLAATSSGCLYTDSAGLFHTTNAACGGGGGGSIGGSGAVGTMPIFVTNTTTLGNSPISVASGVVTSSDPVAVNDSSGLGGGMTGVQATAPSGSSGSDALWADSTGNRWKMNNNNSGATTIPGVGTAGTSGHCVQFASNGIDLVDSGAGCASSGSFTPTHTGDAGAGTGGSLVISFAGTATDDSGYVNLTTGNSPSANSGVVTITFGGTYASARHCGVLPSSALAMALGGNGFFVPQSTTTATKVDITIGAVALPANTTGYQFYYFCSRT